jgi:hypothetical protein
MLLGHGAGREGQRAAVWANQQMHLIDRDESLIKFDGILLLAGIIIDHKLYREFFAMGLDVKPAILVDHVGPDVHELFEWAHLCRHRTRLGDGATNQDRLRRRWLSVYCGDQHPQQAAAPDQPLSQQPSAAASHMSNLLCRVSAATFKTSIYPD